MFRQLAVLVAVVSVPLLLLQAYNLRQEFLRANEAASRAVGNYASGVAQETDTLVAETTQYLVFLASRPLIVALRADQCDPLLDGVTRRRRHIANVIVADLAGRPVCLSVREPGEVPDTLAGFDWFRNASNSDVLSLGKPFLVAGKMALAMSQPLRDAQGVRVGTLAVLLDLESLQNQWARYDLPPNSRISVFDESGTIVATRPDFLALAGKDASAAIRKAKALNPGDAGIAPGVDGVERMFALRPLHAASWEAGVAIPTEHILGPYRTQLHRSLAVMALVIAATFACAFAMTRRMITPLRNLVDVARAIGSGQMEKRASEDVPGEFRVVAHEFNAMLDASRRHVDFYQALSRTNGAIVRASSAALLYEEICHICVDFGHASIAYVSLLEGDTLRHVASAGPAQGFLQGLDVRPGVPGMARTGLSGAAAGSGVRQICNDVEQDPRTEPWRQLGAQIGTRSIAAFPFRCGGATFGTLTLHMTVPGFFNDRVIALLDEMTQDISFALDNLARRKALSHHEHQLAGLVDTAMDAIVSIDGAFRIRLFNRAAGEMFLVRPSDVLGTSLDRFIPARLQSAHAGHLRHFAHTGSTARRMGTHNLVAVRSDGTEFPIDASISKLGEGEDVLMTVVIRDATELRLAQQARFAQVEAESANRAKTDFLSRMSHELRTPLNAVLGFSQLLQGDTQEPLTPGQYGRVEQVRAAGWHLLSLINDVLDLSKIEGGHVSIEDQPVQLQEALDEAMRLVQPAAGAAGIRLIASYRDSSPTWVHADPRRLRQVLINLLSNAIKYNRPDGTVELAVEKDPAGAFVDVIDSGIGMTAAQMEHLYEPFNRLGREQQHGVEGTGLGLALARQLMQLMGGTLDVKSVVGVGTQIRATLRTHEDIHPLGAPHPSHPDSPAAADNANPAGTVLYIEDNPINALLVEQLLKRWPDVTLLQASSGHEGLSIARDRSLDLILLDMRLPDTDGLEVLRALQEHPATRETRVVSLSASAMPEEVDAARQAGALLYWTKPLDFAMFIRDMQRLLAVRP